MDEKDKCKSCKGNKVFKDRKVLEVNIEKGMAHGQKIKFSGEADEIPGTVPGDVVIVIQVGCCIVYIVSMINISIIIRINSIRNIIVTIIITLY